MLDLGQGNLPPQAAIKIAVPELGALGQIGAEQAQCPFRHRLDRNELSPLSEIALNIEAIYRAIVQGAVLHLAQGRAAS